MNERPPYPSLVPRDVCILFEKLTMDLFVAGHDHYSARAILHRIRWHHHVDVGNRSFKANNNWTPALARWVMQCHPEINDFFFLRASPGQGPNSAIHSHEDYMGPYHD